MGSSSSYGVPGILALARTRYQTRRAELLASGIGEREIDERIIAEARAEGGSLAEGERVNLSMWSERFAIPRAVLEAIVLSIHRHEPAPPTVLPIVAPIEHDDAPITPPPAALRYPVSGVRSNVDSVR